MRHGTTRWEPTGTRPWCAALAALWLVGPAAHAADPAPPPAAAAPAPATAQAFRLSDARLGTRTAPLLLLSRPEIQADLKLSAQQAAAAQGAIADLHRQAEALRGRGDGQDAAAARRAIDEAQQRFLASNLSEDQQARLLQIDLQWEGPSALASRPSVIETVGLDDRQVAALRARLLAAMRDPAASRDPLDRARQALLHAREILSEDQQARWLSLLGRPLAFATAAAVAPGPPPR
jgi:hypothetical protein